MSIDPFEAARQRYEQEQKVETERLGELRAALARHGVDIGYRLLQGRGLSGRIWYATSPSRVFLGEPRLRTRAIERFVTTGDPPLRLTVHIVLRLLGRHLDILRELENRRRDGSQ